MQMADVVTHQITGQTCVITIDNPPENVIGHAVRAGLIVALDAAEAAGADRIVITGAGKVFVAGADAKEFGAAPVAPHLPDILQRLERLPAIAAINGAALGGGLEIALACRYRIASTRAVLGLPEVTLGVVPGAGGTQRLPRLIGLEAAVSLIAEGRSVTSAEALALGLVDAVADDPLAAAFALPAKALRDHPALCDRPAPLPAPDAVMAARKAAQKRMPGQIAPLRAIDLVAQTASLPLAEGLAAERATFLALRQSEQATALRHVFFAERAATGRGKRLQGAGDIRQAVVVGGGNMGAGIAYALAGVGIAVTLVETSAEAVTRARANIAGLYADAVKRGKTTADNASADQSRLFDFVTGYGALPAADIAIEAAFEDMAVKKTIFAALDAGLPETTILATNTSYLDVNAIFEGLRSPSRCLGLHFFSPAHVMKLLEVIRAKTTSEATLATAFGLADRLRKIPVEAGVCDGFIGNRILTRYRQTTDVLLIEGALPAEVDAALEGFGMAMGPYAVQDLSGLDIAYANRQRKGLRHRSDIRYVPIADQMVEGLKRLGRKTKAGWYDYPEGARQPSGVVDDLVRAASAAAGITRQAFTAEAIVGRAMLAMIEEGLHILGEGIAQSPADIDLVLVHGYGFPRWRGGPMHYADQLGLAEVLRALQALAKADPLSWSVPPLLQNLVDDGQPLSSLG